MKTLVPVKNYTRAAEIDLLTEAKATPPRGGTDLTAVRACGFMPQARGDPKGRPLTAAVLSEKKDKRQEAKTKEEFTPLETKALKKKAKMSLSGFTLIEIVIVIAIMGILASIAVPQYRRVLERSRQSEAYTNLGAVRGAQLRYSAEYDNFVFGGAAAWNFLDVERPTARYFDYTLPVAATWTATCVARATRLVNATSQNAGFGAYTLDISEDGTITKVPTTTP